MIIINNYTIYLNKKMKLYCILLLYFTSIKWNNFNIEFFFEKNIYEEYSKKNFYILFSMFVVTFR